MNNIQRSLLGMVAIQAALTAQAPLWQSNGSLGNSRQGFDLAIVGDYNGNGTDDVLIGEPGDLGANFVTDGGSALLLDGNGSCITIFYGLASRRMGTDVARLPDINGDGIDEIILGSPGWAAFGTVRRGRVSLYFGGRFGGGAPGCAGAGYATPDLLIDRGNASGGVLNGDEFGVEIEALGDIDGDGIADFAVGAPLGNLAQVPGNHTGYVQVYSGALAFGGAIAPLYTIAGPTVNSRFGDAICGIGDVNGDGIQDLAIGAPDESTPNQFARGRVRCYDGATGSLFLTISGSANHRLGFDIENLGDVDGDGLDDIAVGAIGERPAGATANTGSVTVVTGAFIASAAATAGSGAAVAIPLSGVPNVYKLYGDDLYRATGMSTFADAFGASIANTGDIDGDGIADMLVGAAGSPLWDPDAQIFGNWPSWIDANQTGMARLVSGATGSTIKQYLSTAPMTADNFGSSVAAGGDLDSDGQPDLVIAAPWADVGPTNNGSVFAWSGNTEFGFVYGAGLPNSTGAVGQIAARGSQSVAANGLRIEISSLPPLANGILLMSPTQVVPGNPLGNGLLYVGGTIIRFPVAQSDGFGEAAYAIDMSLPPAVGNLMSLTRWNFQFWHRDAAGTVNLTDAITVGLY